MRIAFLTEEHPICSGQRLVYDRFRFYGAMIAELAKTLGATHVDLIGMADRVKGGHAEFEQRLATFAEKPGSAEEVKLFQDALAPHGIEVGHRLVDLDTPAPEYDLVLFGILNGNKKQLKHVMEHWLRVVERSKGYLYLDSDQELSPRANVFYDHSVTFTQALAELSVANPWRTKLKGYVCTEPPERGYFGQALARFGVPAVYCPVVEYKALVPIAKAIPDKRVDMMFLKYFDRWFANEDFNKTFLDWLHYEHASNKARVPNVTWYETSFPAAKAKKLEQFTPYGIDYEPAKFWRRETMAVKLGAVKLYCGLSTPNGNRFTFKIVEAIQARTLTLVPDLRRALPDLPTDSQKLYLRYTEAGSGYDRRIDYLGKHLGRDIKQALQGVMAMDRLDYAADLQDQQRFFESYFVAGCPHINARMAEIAKVLS